MVWLIRILSQRLVPFAKKLLKHLQEVDRVVAALEVVGLLAVVLLGVVVVRVVRVVDLRVVEAVHLA